MSDRERNAIAIPEGPEARVERTEHHVRILPGTWWRRNERKSEEFQEIPAGTVLLVEDVEELNGVAHAVQIRRHPGARTQKWAPRARKHLAEDLVHAFDEDPDGGGSRQQEVHQLEQRIRDEREAIGQARLRLGSQPVLEQGTRGHRTMLPAVRSHMEMMRQAKESIAQASARIQEYTERLKPYVEERLEAARSAHLPAVREVKEIDRAMDLMRLYTGEDVEVKTYRTGADAQPHEPLTMYQGVLSMDEESLIGVLSGGDGADFRDLDRYMQYLARTLKALVRLAPAPRSVVGIRARAQSKRYENIFESVAMNEQNQKLRLLVRNGENLHLICGPLGEADRLFPGVREREEAFEQVAGVIDRSHVQFAAAVTSRERLHQRYWRHYMTIAGLHERERIFGTFALEVDNGEPIGLLDAAMHAGSVHYVHDADEQALDDTLTPFGEFQEGDNRMLRAGDRVVVRVSGMVGMRSTPTLYSAYQHRHCSGSDDTAAKWGPKTLEPVLAKVVKRGNALMFELRCRGSEKQTRLVHLVEDGVRVWYRIDNRTHVLRLTDVTAHELARYARSRRERTDYRNLIPLVVPGARVLRAEQEGDRGTIGTWKLDADESIEDLVKAATKLRAAGLDSESVEAQHTRRAARSIAAANEHDAAFVTIDQKGYLVTVREGSPAQRKKGLGLPWLAIRREHGRERIGALPPGPRLGGSATREALEPSVDYRLGISYERASEMYDWPTHAAKAWREWVEEMRSAEAVDARLERIEGWARQHTPHWSDEGEALGLEVSVGVGAHETRTGRDLYQVVRVWDPWVAMWACAGDEAIRDRIEHRIRQVYRYGTGRLKIVRAKADKGMEGSGHWMIRQLQNPDGSARIRIGVRRPNEIARIGGAQEIVLEGPDRLVKREGKGRISIAGGGEEEDKTVYTMVNGLPPVPQMRPATTVQQV